MKLFLLTNRAVLTKGKTPAKVSVIQNGEVSRTTGLLKIGDTVIDITDGKGVITFPPVGNVPVSYTDISGKVYDCGVVFFGTKGAVACRTEELEAALMEASKIPHITKEIATIKDQILALKGEVEYQGLDCLFK